MIVDNEDKTVGRYIKNFGSENVVIFDKSAEILLCDRGNNFGERGTVLMARNACFDIAKKLGIKYFLQLDDDYTSFFHRKISEDGKKLLGFQVKNMNEIINIYLNYFKSAGFTSLTFAQGGDFIGGVSGPSTLAGRGFPLLRKAMNSFFCSTERPFKFIGAMNDDVNTYVVLGCQGKLFGTAPQIHIVQKQTQKQAGGLTDMYKRFGTYCKSFTTVMMQPSSVKVSMMHTNYSRIHHLIDWRKTVPCIINQKHKKGEQNVNYA